MCCQIIMYQASAMNFDQVQLNLDPSALTFINWMLAIVMFGVALDLKVADFKAVLRRPKAPAIGLLCQFLLMPAIASLIVFLIEPPPTVALGIMLVSACPGGNVSNFFTSLGKGNAAVSVSMSAVSTMAAIIMTPLNFTFWASVNPRTASLLQDIALSPLDIVTTVFTILILPTFLGVTFAAKATQLAARLVTPIKWFSIFVMVTFVAGASWKNQDIFVEYVGIAFWVVACVNMVGLALGYGLSRLAKLPEADARAVSFETGIQNSGFGLVLAIQFFSAYGGMAITTAWWGVWHLLSGMTLAIIWSRRPAKN
jgi:BASS family bile acid:Na+ symporter